MSSFTHPLIIEFDFESNPKKPYRIARPFEYYTHRIVPCYDKVIRVPVGYRTDFASIPRFFWRILPPAGRYGKAAVIHDFLCDERPHCCSHVVAADVFDEAMEVLGVGKVKRTIMVKAVKWFGPKFKAGDT